MTERSIHQEDKNNTLKNSVSIYIKQKQTDLKGERDKTIIGIEDFNIPLSVINRTSRLKISKDREELHNTITINQWALIDIYRTLLQQKQSS